MPDGAALLSPAPPRPALHQGLWAYGAAFDAAGLVAQAASPAPVTREGCITSFQGAHIPVSVAPDILFDREGCVEAPPAPGNWHACLAEWGGVFHAVRETQAAGRTAFTIVELGCGWAPWLLAAGLEAKRRGLTPQLTGIEADPHHLRQARQTLTLNGLDAALLPGVAAAAPGQALFPRLSHIAQSDWGGEAIMEPTDQQIAARAATHALTPCITLDAVAGETIDLLHIDIQGGERAFVRDAWPALSARVSRILIGTHGRAIEGALHDHFSGHGWRLEVERPALCHVVAGAHQLAIDGVQMWSRP